MIPSFRIEFSTGTIDESTQCLRIGFCNYSYFLVYIGVAENSSQGHFIEVATLACLTRQQNYTGH